MTYRATVLGCLFLLLAIILAGCEVLGVYEYVSEINSRGYILVSGCIIAAICPGLPALADWFWRGKQRLYCVGAWLAFVICLAIVMTAAVQRTGSATDGAERGRIAAERATKIAEAAERQAQADYTAAQAAALRECDVRQKRCMDAEAKAADARAILAKARAALVAAPAGRQTDALATRVAAVVGLTEEQYRLLQPLQVPVALSLLSVLFFAGWARLDFTRPADSVKIPPRSHIPSRPFVAPVPPAAARPQLAIVRAATKPGAVAAFLVSCTEPMPGQSIEIEGAMYGAYRAWCASVGVPHHSPGDFARELVSVGKASGIAIEIRGKEAYCLDRRLAA